MSIPSLLRTQSSPGNLTFEQVQIEDDSDAPYSEIKMLRTLCWSGFSYDAEALNRLSSALDFRAHHWICRDGDRLVASARLSIHDHLTDVPECEVYENLLSNALAAPIGSINRLVVHPEYCGLGIASFLDKFRINAARSLGCATLLAETFSGPRRVSQLTKVGFKIVGSSRASALQKELGRGGTPPVVLVLNCIT